MLMKRFIERKISAEQFDWIYYDNRDIDLDNNRNSGYRDWYSNRSIDEVETNFGKKYVYNIFSQSIKEYYSKELLEYERAAYEYNIDGEEFFDGIWCFVDACTVNFLNCNPEHFDPECDINEEEFYDMINTAYGILERNKDKWMPIPIHDKFNLKK
jgi:hypothetical protein